METKICGRCKNSKILDDFNWKKKKINLRHSVCSACHALYRRGHYLDNREKYIRKARKWNGHQKQKLQRLIFEYLSAHFCIDCGEKDLRVLDFDHRHDKFMGISQMIQNCYSSERVVGEIKKCDVRCANCHRKRTFTKAGYWKSLLITKKSAA